MRTVRVHGRQRVFSAGLVRARRGMQAAQQSARRWRLEAGRKLRRCSIQVVPQQLAALRAWSSTKLSGRKTSLFLEASRKTFKATCEVAASRWCRSSSQPCGRAYNQHKKIADRKAGSSVAAAARSPAQVDRWL